MHSLASFGMDTLAPNALLVPGMPVLAQRFRLAAGKLVAGAVLGMVLGTPTVSADDTNTGTGTLGPVTLAAAVTPGAWRVVCLEPAEAGGVFTVEDPAGRQIGTARVGQAFVGPIGFTLAAGGTGFAAGDAFTVLVPTSTTVRLAELAATDGSAIPVAVLAHDADATAAPVDVIAYQRADVVASAVVLGDGHTLDTVREPLRRRGIALV